LALFADLEGFPNVYSARPLNGLGFPSLHLPCIVKFVCVVYNFELWIFQKKTDKKGFHESDLNLFCSALSIFVNSVMFMNLSCYNSSFSPLTVNIKSFRKHIISPSVAYVFGPPGSGSISQRYGSGSGSFYHQAKMADKL
jgi:hypothetical protein